MEVNGMGKPRNQVSRENGQVIVTNPKGEVIFSRPYRTPLQALVEFKYACDAWMACMDPTTRAAAVQFAQESAANVPFAPNCEPR
jgi:hypothetical protein